jgi:hypothetical protein
VEHTAGVGRAWPAVSWHNQHDEVEKVEKGVRLSLAHVTEWRTPIRYRNLLPVEPTTAPS